MPKDFIRTTIGINLEAFKLEEDALLQAAIRVSMLRKTFREKAEVAATELGVKIELSPEQITNAIKKIQNRAATKKPPAAMTMARLYVGAAVAKYTSAMLLFLCS